MSVNDSKSVVYYNIFSLPVNRPCNYSLIGLIIIIIIILKKKKKKKILIIIILLLLLSVYL